MFFGSTSFLTSFCYQQKDTQIKDRTRFYQWPDESDRPKRTQRPSPISIGQVASALTNIAAMLIIYEESTLYFPKPPGWVQLSNRNFATLSKKIIDPHNQ